MQRDPISLEPTTAREYPDAMMRTRLDPLRPTPGAAALLATLSLVALTGCPGGDASGVTFGTGTEGGSLTAGDSSSITLSGGETTTGGGSNSAGSDSSGAAVDTSGDSGPGGCTGNADCADDPGGPVCDPASGTCVACTADDDPCTAGNYCNDADHTCVPGCANDDDCEGDLTCNVATHGCEGCTMDSECAAGFVCDTGACVPGCNDQQACPNGLACCSNECIDIAVDVAHCGGCDSPCAPDHATADCSGGVCGVGSCDNGYEDCNGAANDGCEVSGACACAPNQQYACYTGPMGTQNVGMCADGVQTCNAQGTALGPCVGQVLPGIELCNSGADENCDGTTDEDPDFDGDGWTQCGGDCCDEIGIGCLAPELVNPGAFEFGGNTVDDDCDGTTDNVVPTCDAGIASNTASADNYARAIDLCQFTDLNPADPADRTWGVINGTAALRRADGTANPAANSRSVRSGFGTVITPQYGARLAVLSSGTAADSNDANPAFTAFQEGQDMLVTSGFPADWLAANGNTLPNVPGCPALNGNQANDPMMFTLDVRVPTNAQSFSVMMYFFSAEYPEYVCTAFNDFFVALVDSTNATNPADGNIAIYDDGITQWPVGVNILEAANGLFTQCSNGAISQCGLGGAYAGCTATNELSGTGFDTMGATLQSCGYNGRYGGGTGWLQMSGNVTPGEVMTLRFAIWDTSDGIYDSLVLLDDFQWSVDASEPGVQPG